MLCRVKNCIAEAAPPSPSPRTVCTSGVCRCHQSLPDAELAELLKIGVGLVEPLQPITDRIEYQRACGCEHTTRETTKRCAEHQA